MGLLGTASHEFFHAWNVERIRPKTLEPFSFEEANISGELWLAEGFTHYYGRYDAAPGRPATPTTTVAGRRVHSEVIRSRHEVPFRRRHEPARAVHRRGVSIDSTNWPNTFYSYYTFGEAIALGLDLSLRDRSNERSRWTTTCGDVDGARQARRAAPGLVAKPYTLADARARLAEVSGDKAFADDFFTVTSKAARSSTTRACSCAPVTCCWEAESGAAWSAPVRE